jgi:hypothetical protein
MPLVLILGMHRSGTSFLTKSLHEAGCHLGADLLADTMRDNLEGHWESRQAVEINDHLLQLAGGAWNSIPERLRSDPETDERMAAFVRTLQAHRVAGWKDPRTTITFPLWKPHLPDYRVVAALRHPMSVARSLHVRNGMAIEDGLRLWTVYNERLLGHIAGESDVLWFDFDAPPEQVAASVRRICAALGLTCSERVESLFNPYLRHHARPEAITDPAAAELYRRLRAMAGASALAPDPGPAAPGDESSLADSLRRLSTQLDQLGRALALQNANQQAIERVTLDHIVNLNNAIGGLSESLWQAVSQVREDALFAHQRITRLEPDLRVCVEFVQKIRTSPPYRLAGAVGRLLRRALRRAAPADAQQHEQVVAPRETDAERRRAA